MSKNRKYKFKNFIHKNEGKTNSFIENTQEKMQNDCLLF